MCYNVTVDPYLGAGVKPQCGVSQPCPEILPYGFGLQIF